MAEVNAEVLHEFVVHHRGRRAAGTFQKGLQTCSAHVVYAGQPEHVELIEGQAGLHRPQRLNLTAHADGQQPADAAAGQLLQHLQIGRQGGLVHPRRQHLLGGAGQQGHRRKSIVGALAHAEHRIHQAPLQGEHADAAHDAGPLGAIDRLAQAAGEHALLHTEIKLVFLVEVAAAAVGRHFHRLEALVQKGAALLHISHPAAVAKTALAAEVLGGIDAALGQGPGALVGKGGWHGAQPKRRYCGLAAH